jgi:hypothetical protein
MKDEFYCVINLTWFTTTVRTTFRWTVTSVAKVHIPSIRANSIEQFAYFSVVSRLHYIDTNREYSHKK